MAEIDALTAGTDAATEYLAEHVGEFDPHRVDMPAAEREHGQAIARAVLDAAGFGLATLQPMPTRTDEDGAHDRVIEWLHTSAIYRAHRERGDVQWVVAGLAGRKAFGLRKYGTVLQAGNGRDVGQDCVAEVLDAIAYAQIGLDQATAADDEADRSFWWQRRNRLTEDAIQLYRRLAAQVEWTPVVDVEPEGDEAALTVRRDASTA